MPRIPHSVLDCIIYLYAAEQHAQDGHNTGGSGFIVFIPSVVDKSRVYAYAITNRHCLDDGFTVVRMQTPRGEIITHVTQRNDWVNHRDGDDVAALDIFRGPPEMPKLVGFTTGIFLTREDVERVDLGPGDDVYMIGRFVSYDGREYNQPTARFGNIAMSPVPVTHPRYGIAQESFLVDMRSLSGYSGSPVFTYIAPRWNRPHMKLSPGETTRSVWFMGIDWGMFRVKGRVLDKDENPLAQGWFVKLNSGISPVIPAWRVLDLLNAEELVVRRKQHDDELAKKAKDSPVELTSESLSPGVTKEQFMKDLETVVRRDRSSRRKTKSS